MDATLAVLVAVLGWLVSYQLGLRAQHKHFAEDITNRARLDLVAAFRDAQHWLNKASTMVSMTSGRIELEEAGLEHDWREKIGGWSDVAYGHRNADRWNALLEEYAILFPYTADLRLDLQARAKELRERLQEISRSVVSSIFSPEGRKMRQDLLPGLKEAQELLVDQAALFQDLIVLLQNRTLGPILRRRIPVRQIPDPDAPRVVEESDGRLTILVPSQTGPERPTGTSGIK